MKKILVGSSIVVVRIFGLKLSRTSLNNCRPTPLRVWFLCNFVVNWIHLGSWFFNFGDFLTQCVNLGGASFQTMPQSLNCSLTHPSLVMETLLCFIWIGRESNKRACWNLRNIYMMVAFFQVIIFFWKISMSLWKAVCFWQHATSNLRWRCNP